MVFLKTIHINVVLVYHMKEYFELRRQDFRKTEYKGSSSYNINNFIVISFITECDVRHCLWFMLGYISNSC